MKTSALSLCVLVACCFTIAACSRATQVLPAQSVSNGKTFSDARNLTENYRVLHSFLSDSTDGGYPVAGLIDVHGKLYGTTQAGGANGIGTVFSITTAGVVNVLYSFGAGTSDGNNPLGTLVDLNGTLYGTTLAGGAHGSGTVFSITTTGTEKVLHSFGGGSSDGKQPYAGLIDVNGTLYGTTYAGGKHAAGTVFSITTTGSERVLHSFGGSPSDGKRPKASLVDVKGTLFGTTSIGGGPGCNTTHRNIRGAGCGTVFSIKTTGTENVLHHFGILGTNDGFFPDGGLVDVKGRLYGTTLEGGVPAGSSAGGTVFSITTDGNEKVLHSFNSRAADGQEPEANLIVANGTLYGTTDLGGAHSSGTVFSVTTAGIEKVLHSFGGASPGGTNPTASLVDVTGTFYGTTYLGGDGYGTVFSLTP